MLHGSTHPGVAGSELTHLLARLADAPALDARPALADRLGQWLGWTGAITLASALNAKPGPSPGPSSEAAAGMQAELRRVQDALARGILAGPAERPTSPTDFGPYRRHVQACQQTMQDGLATVRAQLREALARQGPAGARLAAIDAALAPALQAQERLLLGLVPLRLQAHFERLQQAQAPLADESSVHARLREDLHALLLAELAHRLLPVQGLLAALERPSAGSNRPHPAAQGRQAATVAARPDAPRP